MTRANTALRMLGPSAAVTAIAKMMVGKAIKSSVRRIKISSHTPPKKPATAPMSQPTTPSMRTTANPAGMVMRPPVKHPAEDVAPEFVRPQQVRAVGRLQAVFDVLLERVERRNKGGQQRQQQPKGDHDSAENDLGMLAESVQMLASLCRARPRRGLGDYL